MTATPSSEHDSFQFHNRSMKEAIDVHKPGEGENDTDSKVISNSFVKSLKACARIKDLNEGSRIHAEISNSGLLRKNKYLGNTLVNMYAKCGALGKAQEVFSELRVRDVVSWSSLISGYVQHGEGKEALNCFHRMQADGLSPNAYTFACILKACVITKDIEMGKKIHDDIVSQGLLNNDVVLSTALIDMYSKCGFLEKAKQVLEELPVKNVASWSTLIAGYTRQGRAKESLDCFQQLLTEGISPDAITYVCTLKACGIAQNALLGEKIHDDIVSQGLLENNVILGCALVDMYAECGALVKAQTTLDGLLFRSISAWNALIAGYVRHGYSNKSFDCFQRMQREGTSPDAITYACILKGCSETQNVDIGKRIHEEIVDQELLRKDAMLGTALVDMYAKCGVLDVAHNVLVELSVQSIASWNALIGGYAQHGHGKEALSCFYQMQSKSLSPDAITYVCILKACSITQDANMGKRIHSKISSQGHLKENGLLGIALVDMYAKCGLLVSAQKVLDQLSVGSVAAWTTLMVGYAQQGKGQEALHCFKQMQSKGFSPDIASWNALIGGYSQQGLAEESLTCFQRMQEEATFPDSVTFISVLNACSHSGLVDEGQIYFVNMWESYGITPCQDHYTCMIDLFGRAKLLDKAMQIIATVPLLDGLSGWLAFLNACRERGNIKLARTTFDYLKQLDGRRVATHVLMSSIYASACMLEDAENIEWIRTEKSV